MSANRLHPNSAHRSEHLLLDACPPSFMAMRPTAGAFCHGRRPYEHILGKAWFPGTGWWETYQICMLPSMGWETSS